ncbi:MAG: hypothetical protein PVJ72_13160 [Gammaproteobacteria bacterium]|jgi:hypothetical protein
MEHRCNIRLQIAIEVMLYHNGISVISGKSRDVGVEGLFVECGALIYKNNTLLEVEFEVTSITGRQVYRLSAMVVHRSKDGLGLFVRDEESQASTAWREAVQSAASQAFIDEPHNQPIPVFT